MEPAVVVQGLTYQYKSDGPLILKNINFQVAQGEILAIMGLSGCGKSTLCSCLCGIIPHYWSGLMAGKVMVNGKNIQQFNLANLALEVGMVFQNPDTQLFSSTVEDEIAFAPENMCLAPDIIRERVDQVISLLGITALREAKPNQLSGGEKHLVALAAVLALDPPVLILDEVMSQLDSDGKKLVASAIKTLHTRGKTIVAVEHDLETVNFADRLLVMNDGEIVRIDVTESLLADRDFLLANRLAFA
ncbi:ABC transporter ATP-binding protein [Desulfosporosinus sp. Tol-M]|nr:ABC transporter ATP-binding protein [Desulfosporosinus sp. Tol-M]